MYALHHPLPRYRQPSSTSSTLLSTSGSGGSDAWMPPASTSTSRSIFSDGEEETRTQKYREVEGDELTEVGTVVDKVRERDDQPLIDFGDGYQQDDSFAQTYGGNDREGGTQAQASGPTPTPGDKLRLLLRQMEAEVRNTTPAPPPPAPTFTRRRQSSSASESGADPTPAPTRSHWREGRRIGALPKERSYSPEPSRSPPRSPLPVQEEEEMEVLDDSPPTPPLRITNPYLYNTRRVSDERELRSSAPSGLPSNVQAGPNRLVCLHGPLYCMLVCRPLVLLAHGYEDRR